MITIRLKDGKELHFENEVTLFEAAKKISNSLAKDVLVAKVDGELTDIRNNITDGTQVEFFTKADKEGLFTLRHTAAHVMAQAIQHLYPGTKFAIGPAIDDGFYYDLESDHVFSQEDFAAIEKEMAKIAKANLPIEKKILSRNEALEFFRSRNQDYKVILIQDLPEDAIISTYTQGDFTDLCRGPHVRSTGKLKVFKLMTVAGAYWRGDEHNKMLQRIYATAFFDKEELDRFLFVRAEAEKRDHRKLGKQLNLFSFHEEGPGFPFFHPKGMVIRNELIAYERELFREFGYEEIMTPIILSKKLWLQSGHWDHYKENMYFTQIDEEDYAVKPMNCPGGILYYKTNQHSYRELPKRVGEFGIVHRHELHGALHGLFRVRVFTQDDAHIFMTQDQMKDCLGRTWQCGTIQMDMQLPERFDVNYVGEDGEKHRAVMLHRAGYGSLERFIGILIEHFAGAFPSWIAPVQVKVVPVTEKHMNYARSVADALSASNVRVEIEEGNDTLGYKIRKAQMEKVPYTLVVGDKEMNGHTVSVRSRKNGDEGSLPVAVFVSNLIREIRDRSY